MTTLVMITILFFGAFAYYYIPVSDLPNAEYPTIEVTTSFPGASPETMADTVTSPLEREFTSVEGIQTIASSSTNGTSTIVLQFDLDRSIDSASTDVQAAINRATPNLPSNLPSAPTYTKTNPSQTPIIYYAVTSDTVSRGDLYDYAYALMGRQLGMIQGVSDVVVYGSKYAVRVQLDPGKLAAHQIGIDEVAKALNDSNPQEPLGGLFGPNFYYTISVDGQIKHAEGYNNLIIRNDNQSLLKIRDVGHAIDSLQNDKMTLNYYDHDEQLPCVVIGVRKQLGSNTMEIIKEVKAQMKTLQWALPASVNLHVIFDQSEWIQSSIDDVKLTLLIAFILVVLVVLFYLGKITDTIIPMLALPLSITGTLACMYLCGFNIDILSILAITLSMGFLVDDAIVVLENIIRHMEKGKNRYEAALIGTKEISQTVLSMTLCLCAIFIPMIFMPGILGRIFREFALTITIAILFSGVIALSLTPMLCSRFAASEKKDKKPNFIQKASLKLNRGLLNLYTRGLKIVLKRQKTTLLVGLGSVVLTLFLFSILPRDFLPSDDLGFIQGFTLTADNTSPEKMIQMQEEVSQILKEDDNIDHLISVAGVPNYNEALMFISLKPIKQRKPMKEVVKILTKKLEPIPGKMVFFRPTPLINLDVGTQTNKGNYQITLQSLDKEKLNNSTEKLLQKMRSSSKFSQVISDLRNKALYYDIKLDRDRASDLNITATQLEHTFSMGYSAGRLSLINGVQDQYYLIVETLPSSYKSPQTLQELWVSSSENVPFNALLDESSKSYPAQVPSSIFTNGTVTIGPQSIMHINNLPSTTITYDLKGKTNLGDAIQTLDTLTQESIEPGVNPLVLGSANAFASSFSSLSILTIIALFVIYIILGILYENFIHPITVMSALPPAMLGGTLTLLIFNQTLSLYSFVGMIMLLGIVLKNGILLVDFANEKLKQGLEPATAVFEACTERFRPIIMTTFSAMMGAVPIALGIGGLTAESRKSLGLVIVGGLIISQLLTLFLTPVLFLSIEQLRERLKKKKDLKKL
ncbi:acriflavine resistance protein B [Candidatus Aerophobetes bacterium]|uniref:Acriflavine resistance protein B n=1 Tax=Aerophobetes bacterium TaxID=2030807 RepID=A0A2A4X2K4_UNCAE|nr:MAG: acriflavine resistance protein B [Candidatus Aerophobetes bacterium]